MSLIQVQPETALFIGLCFASLRGNFRVKRSPLINDAGIGCACPSPAVSAAHACGIVCQGQQLLRQLPAVHQQKHGRLCCRLHLQHKTQSTLRISRKTTFQNIGATKMSCVCNALSARGSSSCGSCRSCTNGKVRTFTAG